MKTTHKNTKARSGNGARPCVVCGKEVRRSPRAKCCTKKCEMRRVRDSVKQLRERQGPLFRKWKRNITKLA